MRVVSFYTHQTNGTVTSYHYRVSEIAGLVITCKDERIKEIRVMGKDGSQSLFASSPENDAAAEQALEGMEHD